MNPDTTKKYALLIPTSMGIRLTPVNSQPFHCSDTFKLQVTSAESNAGSIASYLGLPVKIVTAFVKESPIAHMIKDNLKSRRMDFEGPEFDQAGPWGYRHQINMADSGWGSRGSRVYNDRTGEVGREMNAKDFDLERIFEKEGASIVHLSGLFAALSPKTSTFCLEIVRIAKNNGSLISFDLNHRASFWQGREKELAKAFSEIASHADILIGHKEHFRLCLGIENPDFDDQNIDKEIESLKGMIDKVRAAYPKTTYLGTTMRKEISANLNQWGVLVTGNKEWEVIKPREIGVLDRIGGGDGFVGGLLYGILKGWDIHKSTRFGWACGALAVTMLTDYAQPADEEQIWRIWEGNARVKR